MSISQKTVFYDSAALLDVGLQYTFKWVELWMDDKGVSFSDYEQIIGNLDASQVAVSAGISCLAATFPFVPSSKKKLIVALIAGLGDGAYAMVDDIYNQYDELSKKDPKASIKTIFEKLSWKQALTAGGSNFLITTISTGVVLYAKSNPKFVDFAQKLEAKIKKQGTVFLERAGLNKEAVETLLRKLKIRKNIPKLAFRHTPTSGVKIFDNEPVGTFLIGGFPPDLMHIIEELKYPKMNVLDLDFSVPLNQKFNLLNVSEDIYNYWSKNGGFFTMVNGPWIDAAVKQKRKIIVVSDVRKFIYDSTKKLTGFGKEVHRLEWKHGYRYDPKTNTMVPPNEANGLTTLTSQTDYVHK